VARLQQATGAAAITILKLMTDLNTPAAFRLRLPSRSLIIRSRQLNWRISKLELRRSKRLPQTQIGGDELTVRTRLLERLKRLEACLPSDEGPQKAPLPEWLMEEYEKLGLRIDSLGRIERVGLDSNDLR
jgi:hypothetical protein